MADTSGKSDREIERDLGLYPGAIGRWRKGLEVDTIEAVPGSGHQKPLIEEVRRLRSLGLEPSKLSRRQKFNNMARLTPLAETNYNFIELGPR